MRVLVSLLVGFVVGGLLLSAGVEWVLDRAAGPCAADCGAYRDWLPTLVLAVGWAAAAWAVHTTWRHASPQRARSAYEERIRHLRRGGR
ncbi:MAG: hypothetical protein KQH83_05140 [Actinobacteria bacterium]|nr:hypothetical protein [Actinomycetota bacterium]